MIRTAILVSGNGALLQTILDSMYFGEIPNYELVAVICTEENAYAMRRCQNAGVKAIVVDTSDFPTNLSYSMAISNKMRDMDIDLVVLAGYNRRLEVIANQFKNRIIGVYPSLVPAFEKEENPVRSVLERGCKIAGATTYFADSEGGIGPIIGQCAVEVKQDDGLESLGRRIMEEAEWKLLSKAIILYCQERLEIHGDRVIIKEN